MLNQTIVSTISKNKPLLTELELEDLRKLMQSPKNNNLQARNYLSTINFKEREDSFFWQEHQKEQNIPHESEFKMIKNIKF